MVRKRDILGYIERLNRETQIPIVYVSYSIEEVARLADCLVVRSTGRIAAADDLADVMGLLGLQPLTGRYKAGAVFEAHIASHDPQFELTRLNFAGGDCASRSCKCPWEQRCAHIRAGCLNGYLSAYRFRRTKCARGHSG